MCESVCHGIDVEKHAAYLSSVIYVCFHSQVFTFYWNKTHTVDRNKNKLSVQWASHWTLCEPSSVRLSAEQWSHSVCLPSMLRHLFKVISLPLSPVMLTLLLQTQTVKLCLKIISVEKNIWIHKLYLILFIVLCILSVPMLIQSTWGHRNTVARLCSQSQSFFCLSMIVFNIYSTLLLRWMMAFSLLTFMYLPYVGVYSRLAAERPKAQPLLRTQTVINHNLLS